MVVAVVVVVFVVVVVAVVAVSRSSSSSSYGCSLCVMLCVYVSAALVSMLKVLYAVCSIQCSLHRVPKKPSP